MSKTPVVVASLLLIAITATAHAQISWGGVQADTGSASDIKTNGTFFDAINTTWNGSYTTTTIGDTTFNALSLDPVSSPSRYTSDGTITDIITGGDGNFGGVGAPTNNDNAADTALGYVINHSSDGTATVTIGSDANPLTIGDQYQVQIWGYWSNTMYGAQVDGDPGVTFPNGGGGYAIGTFTAGATTETFSYTGNADSFGAGFIADIAVRQVPEPATYALIGLGLLTLGAFGTKLRKLAA